VNPSADPTVLDEAIALHRKGRLAEAAELYRKVLIENPLAPEALHLLGLIEFQRKNANAALVLMDRSIEIDPGDAGCHSNRGVVLRSLGRFGEAIASFDRVLALRPANADAHLNRGAALFDVGRYVDAVADYDRALSMKPNHADAHTGRGHALQALGRLDEAVESYEKALSIKPDSADVLVRRGDAQRKLKRFDDAIASYQKALDVRPDYPFLQGTLLLYKLRICDWHSLDRDASELERKIEGGERVSPPFTALVLPLSAARQRTCAEIYVRERHAPNTSLPPLQRHRHDRIRLGYFSADYRNHPVAALAAGMFEHHDRSRFEVIAFSLESSKHDAMRARLEKAFDRFIAVDTLSDRDAALIARSHEIDIAIDLSGFTDGSRTGIFACRAAPIQVNYLGYPGTMGTDYIDYIVADDVVIPPAEQQHYAEKIAYVPDTYQVNDSRRVISDRVFKRTECGLPERGFVFCCFNRSYKVLPAVFDVWMRLLRGVPDSVLWLLAEDQGAMERLRTEAKKRGVDPGRLVFAKQMLLAEHLARQRVADLFLDTLPYNAHTTASDALWAGLPVLTCLGNTFPGRVGASLLRAVGMPELIAADLAAYESLALELAMDSARLPPLKQKLAAGRPTQPLFDTARFTRNIERVFLSMWERQQAGLEPDHIHVGPAVDPS
jgi:predicted O-linked N-acetylglucosamine transferase (SPINDLY family)